MPKYDHQALERIAIEHADALCEQLAGDWHRTEAVQTTASIARDDCELYLWGFEQAGTARLSIQAQLPEGWGAVDHVGPPEITVSTDRDIESIATDIARRLLPVHAELAARVRDALESEERRQAVSSSIIDHFLVTMPGGVPDLHQPGSAVSSSGPEFFSASMRLGHDAHTADLHLRGAPIELVRDLIDLAGRHLDDGASAEGSPNQVLDDVAEAITTLASARKRIPVKQLLKETGLNILILARIASNRLDDRVRREEIESATDHLVTQLRHAAWDLPSPAKPTATPTEH